MKGLTLIVCLSMLLGVDAHAQWKARATQNLTMAVRPVTRLTVSGDPADLVIRKRSKTATAEVRDNKTQYSVLTNVGGLRIAASIDRPMPQGTHLMIQLGSSQGKSLGTVDISRATLPVDVVAVLGKGSEQNQPIVYTFAADPTIDDLALDARTVTLTMTE